MSEHKKVKGPATYFPSIENKYGHPVDYWFKLLSSQKESKDMDMVGWLKSEHEIGHGHANALVAHFRHKEGL